MPDTVLGIKGAVVKDIDKNNPCPHTISISELEAENGQVHTIII